MASTVTVTRDPTQLARTREWLSSELSRGRSLDVDRADMVVLMASELLTNAIVHTTSEAQLTVSIDGAGVRVAVQDHDPRPPVLQPLDVRRPRGNGLRIIDAWADAWGTEPTDDGKIVWFTVSRR